MDVRERLRTAPAATAPSSEDASRIFRRGRARRRRRQAAGAGGAIAAVAVAAAIVWPAGSPTTPVVDDGPGVAGAPQPPAAEPDDLGVPDEADPSPPRQQTVDVGRVTLTLPGGAKLRTEESGPVPCAAEADLPTLLVLEAISPEPPPTCPMRDATVSTVVAAPAPTVPPAMLPGHAQVDDGGELEEIELLGTSGVTETFDRADGTRATTYLFEELELYLEVLAPHAQPQLLEDLLATAELADGAAPLPTDADDAQPSSTPPIDGEASTDDRELTPDGPADLVLVDVRMSGHDGFDRVTFEFAGDGRVGAFVGIRDGASEDGSGRDVAVAGDAVLEVFANMLAFPPEAGSDAPEWQGVTIPAPEGTEVVTEVVGSVWFEGQRQMFIGLDEPVPYRVVRMGQPERLVIDLLHP